MRCMGNNKKTITATPRQLDSMIRLAEALAKMSLCTEVTAENIEESVRLIKAAMQQSATDPKLEKSIWESSTRVYQPPLLNKLNAFVTSSAKSKLISPAKWWTTASSTTTCSIT